MIYYAGIGARKTPNDIIKQMILYGSVFAELGYTLRSGAADGADSAFEIGSDSRRGLKEIYLPWYGFNNHGSNLFVDNDAPLLIAAEVYGRHWNRLSSGSKMLMGRNMLQILGQKLDTPVSFVVCWTPDGCKSKEERNVKTGGTGQAIALASMYDIPIFNLQRKGEDDLLLNFIGGLNDE